MSNIENIDSYLDGSMEQADRLAFEQQLKSDPELQREFRFQESVVDGIKEARRLQLKTRLSGIDVSALTSSSGLSAGTIAAGVVITAGLIIGGYYFFGSKNDVPAEISQQTEQTIEQPEEPHQTPSVSDTVQEEDSGTVEIIADEEEELAQHQITTPLARDDKTAKEDETSIDDLVKPDIPAAVVQDDEAETVAAIDVPEPGLENTETTRSSGVEIEMRSKRRYDFHYTFEQNKLVLYGDFSDEPYELIELKNDEGLSLFLYYKSRYYGLDKSARDIVPLTEVTSNQIRIKLDQQRNKE